ncbi:LpxI family protein [Candidatus Laterigemmans baculatus]|uniref:LpxI family protein n=1 Tax=Candidatus Laterigemmans baculatus TaxID=2770505 RepID=UPI0013D9DC70|nr:UDP-2,3-diacylglucosamine diphosphatase LpxI [Candidatus Laterigemmans baculatus]
MLARYQPRFFSASKPASLAGGDRRPVGLVAGWGRFPVLVAEALVRNQQPVVCVALSGLADRSLESICDDVRWLGVGKLGGHMRFFRRHGVHGVTMAGKLFKAELLFQRSVVWSQWPDLECIRTFAPHFIFRHSDTRDDSLLTAVTDAFERNGMEVRPATDFAPELLVEKGSLTQLKPSAGQRRDIRFGWTIAKQMGGLDIGQAITVRDGTVIAVEAVEGTDACIDRSGTLCRRGGWTLIKVAKPAQDMRFDVPTIGPQTVERVHAAGGRAIAIEAERTIVVDAAETAALADRLGVAIVAIDAADADAEVA